MLLLPAKPAAQLAHWEARLKPTAQTAQSSPSQPCEQLQSPQSQLPCCEHGIPGVVVGQCGFQKLGSHWSQLTPMYPALHAHVPFPFVVPVPSHTPFPAHTSPCVPRGHGLHSAPQYPTEQSLQLSPFRLSGQHWPEPGTWGASLA